MDVSENSGTPKSSILIGFSIRNHPFWGTPIFGNTLMDTYVVWYQLLYHLPHVDGIHIDKENRFQTMDKIIRIIL